LKKENFPVVSINTVFSINLKYSSFIVVKSSEINCNPSTTLEKLRLNEPSFNVDFSLLIPWNTSVAIQS